MFFLPPNKKNNLIFLSFQEPYRSNSQTEFFFKTHKALSKVYLKSFWSFNVCQKTRKVFLYHPNHRINQFLSTVPSGYINTEVAVCFSLVLGHQIYHAVPSCPPTQLACLPVWAVGCLFSCVWRQQGLLPNTFQQPLAYWWTQICIYIYFRKILLKIWRLGFIYIWCLCFTTHAVHENCGTSEFTAIL